MGSIIITEPLFQKDSHFFLLNYFSEKQNLNLGHLHPGASILLTYAVLIMRQFFQPIAQVPVHFYILAVCRTPWRELAFQAMAS